MILYDIINRYFYSPEIYNSLINMTTTINSILATLLLHLNNIIQYASNDEEAQFDDVIDDMNIIEKNMKYITSIKDKDKSIVYASLTTHLNKLCDEYKILSIEMYRAKGSLDLVNADLKRFIDMVNTTLCAISSTTK